MDYKPIVHPYVSENELSMFSYFNNLVKEGVVRVAEYNEFLIDEDDTDLYKQYFYELYDEMKEYFEIQGGKKQLEKLQMTQRMELNT